MPQEIEVPARSPESFRALLPAERFAEFEHGTDVARELLAGRVVWNVNSTAKGGGVVELLRPLVGYARGAGIDVRWVVIDGTPEFFAITKRIHNRLHGAPGDGGPLGSAERQTYERVLAENLGPLLERIQPGDVVIVHDPQPAGMIPAIHRAGAVVIWRCHVGLEDPNDLARETWAFLLPYVREADAYVFSREAFAWDGLDRDRIAVIHPTIDAFAAKNVDLDPGRIRAVLRVSGIVTSQVAAAPVPFVRQDGTPGRIERRATMIEDRHLGLEDPVVLQVSRWDALKDPIGVITGFAKHVPPELGAHLVYAGPAVEAVADDPEGRATLEQSIAARAALPAARRERIHLATLPMQDLEENAIIVNALQRHAAVIVQKSLSEGFGLTVAEAMWKSRPVVASRIGGIQEQIVDGESGILLNDPRDLREYAGAVAGLLSDRERAERIGHAARERVRDRFLSVQSLLDYLALICRLLPPPSAPESDASRGSTPALTGRLPRAGTGSGTSPSA